jgi:hypothetical protein
MTGITPENVVEESIVPTGTSASRTVVYNWIESSRFYSLVGRAIVFCGLLGWAFGPRNPMKN